MAAASEAILTPPPALLADAAHFPDWNSTVTSIDGQIAVGQQLAIRVPLDPKRTFKPKVTKLTATSPS